MNRLGMKEWLKERLIKSKRVKIFHFTFFISHFSFEDKRNRVLTCPQNGESLLASEFAKRRLR